VPPTIAQRGESLGELGLVDHLVELRERATVSMLPPASNGTTILTVWSGNCAWGEGGPEQQACEQHLDGLFIRVL
jgi:hypothetical protein